jgi:NADPH:quinone reductase-like Zn-dependent oxidoreductase
VSSDGSGRAASVKAVVHDKYGPPEVLRLGEVERPVPADDEILVRVHATTVNRTDCHRRGADPFLWRLLLGLRRPKRRVLGMEFAGVVEAVGSAVDDFAVGDEVFGLKAFGAHAELLCIPARKLVVHKPANITFEQAAAVPDGAVSALTCLGRAGVGPGKHVLVYGASGSIGTAAVQLAKHMGARVTAVCNTKNVEVVRSLGADEVLDYTAGDDFTKNRQAYDVVVDAVGKHSFMRSRHALKAGGSYIATDGMRNFVLAPLSRLGSRRVALPVARARKDDVLLLKQLLENGEYRAVIDRSYPLEDIVDASRYVETQQKTGNVVLTVVGDGKK